MKITATTSKLLLFADFTVAILLTAIVVTGAFLDHDMTAVTEVTLAWDGQLAVAVGFYYWKAKNENRSKGVQRLITDMAEKYGMESVAQMADIIFKE